MGVPNRGICSGFKYGFARTDLSMLICQAEIRVLSLFSGCGFALLDLVFDVAFVFFDSTAFVARGAMFRSPFHVMKNREWFVGVEIGIRSCGFPRVQLVILRARIAQASESGLRFGDLRARSASE